MTQLPLRILFKGPSTLIWTSMMSGPRSDLAFPRVMEAELLKHRPVDSWVGARNGWMTEDLFETWEEELSAWSPDVVVLFPAHMETVHAILPPWLERGANAISRRPGRLRKIYYRVIMRGLARSVLHLQRRVDGPGRFQWRVKRALGYTQEYLRISQQVQNPLILLMELHHPTKKRVDWFPGWPARRELLNDTLRALADDYDNVRFVRICDLMEKFDPGTPEDLWADGIHFNTAFHRAIGEKVAGIVEDWAQDQPHLAQ
ncbi:MAG: SGNH/GDSL hydrolase family protein, partial [Nocardioidaceae bacterium]|nr:SGNH/GDSL hydrolase family protein [Nocardioidaceae bacterium]